MRVSPRSRHAGDAKVSSVWESVARICPSELATYKCNAGVDNVLEVAVCGVAQPHLLVHRRGGRAAMQDSDDERLDFRALCAAARVEEDTQPLEVLRMAIDWASAALLLSEPERHPSAMRLPWIAPDVEDKLGLPRAE
eukprot:scaffold71566_cov30-Tisochrysis_lutea.AAC.3